MKKMSKTIKVFVAMAMIIAFGQISSFNVKAAENIVVDLGAPTATTANDSTTYQY